ncbi:MAG: glycoside hydrolase family 5 protein, partial [Methanobacteriota archaeon]
MAPKHVAMTALAVLLSLTVSGCLSAPAKAPSTIGFVYASGGSLMVDGSAVQLFGPNDQYVFINAMIASGLWGTPDPNAWGNNGLFPSGPDGHIDGITDADSLWHEYFRYFLHYQAVGSPRPNMVRVWIADDTWYPNGVYDAWKSDPATFWAIFDRMVYWAHQAGVYVVPVLGHFATQKDNTFFDTSSPEYLKHVEATKAILARYDGDSTIAMWDLWNEPDVDNDVYWASVGGITALKAWANALISDVRPSAPTHPLTLGFGGWTLFPGLPTDYGLAYWLFYYGGLD